jgi:hypothetical protein
VFALILCLALNQQAALPAAQPSTPAVDGKGSPTVTIPRIEAQVTVDGRLDEDVWARAARLGGFWQYQPVDGRPAEERTDVLLWYSPTALHIGIIAYDREPGSVRATVADRDNLDRDDTVSVYLDTFNDRRRAFVFTVNPLGIQQDGVLSETGFNAGMMFGGSMSGSSVDKNPDYEWDSRGRRTDDGFVVEVRIPFKSLRYPGNGPQTWGLNIQRKVQRTGYVDTWTDARRANSSFLSQAGAIDGIHDMKRGVVTELQPFVTTASNGVAVQSGKFERGDIEVNPGANLRFGFTNLSIDATVNPDFSQVESDAGQVTVNERFALFYPEKRPFFLEGIELFSTPNQLVYSRQIAAPLAGGKLTGKFGRLNVAYLTVKDKDSAGGALFNVGRVRADFGKNSTIGATFTDRSTSGDFSRVAAVDSRVVFAKLYYVQGQFGRSWTGLSGDRLDAPIWLAEFDRTGRAWGFNYKLTGIGENFQAHVGYVPRSDIVEFHGSNRLSWYGARGAFVEQFTTFFGPALIWRYSEFGHASPIEGGQDVNLMFNLRGGWSVRGSLGLDFVRFEPGDYSAYEVLTPGGPIPFAVPDALSNLFGTSVSLTTPTFKRFNASVETRSNAVAIFAEASEGQESRVSGSVAVRPTESIRLDGSTTFSRITRAGDGSEFARTIIPRIKIEYQPTRALFFRAVAEYRSQRQAALVDPTTGQPLMKYGRVADAGRFDGVRIDFLVSFEPRPGTVAFFGYGSALETGRVLSLEDLTRQTDGFFIKLAYLFRR